MRLPHLEPDVTCLDIRENGKFAKSSTRFKYATLLRNENNLLVDYIIKTDSDTLISPRMVFEWIGKIEAEHSYDSTRTSIISTGNENGITDGIGGATAATVTVTSSSTKGSIANSSSSSNTYNSQRKLIFGGSPFDKRMCGWPSHEHCENFTAPVYMGGAFYFVSIDLAEYISSESCPRKNLFIPHEDVTMGNYVFSHPSNGNITIFGHPRGYRRVWRHPLKAPTGLINKRIKFMSEEKVQGAKEMVATRQANRRRKRRTS